MSLMKTLGKVAMGVVIAKGVGKMLGGGNKGGSGGGLGDLLGGLTGGGRSQSGSAGLDDLIGGLSGRNGGGGLGGLLDSIGDNNQSTGGGLGDLFNNALQGNNVSVSNSEEEKAKIMLRAMLNAVKADGQIDAAEQAKITEHLGDVSPEEAEFVRRELNSPLDTQSLVNDIPRGMEQQVYFMSLLAIDLDSNAEAQYLDQLAKGLNMSQNIVNQIHQKVGAPQLYA